ncbi:hypothetical protein HNQ35_002415 [Cerasibacillus quisquiliarum]|uniref:DUF5085 domain-containing protein n=1 Tax=Cerasibacillus quisquiliarum TaxID=227865 RepID=A0A511V446_9BACI|nr:DUF5085 family protein [Cerasibacillus quisquiliarum]MBB5147198.1 hypothetical protein [Cerasibacillus quisquiliarum]GEN32012.1 hypothetical protein CQU01_22500 [Cerasibacillus quisquiliarum]
MIFDNHRIHYRNVVSKYYKFTPAEIDAAISDFVQLLDQLGYHPVGRYFYALLSEPTDELMVAEIFIPIEENDFHNTSNEEMYFRSYFNIEPMVMTRVMENYEEEAQIKYWDLMRFIKNRGLEQKTPMFFEFKSSNNGKAFVEMGFGI